MSQQEKYTDISINELENSEMEISGEIPAETFQSYIDEVLENAKENAEIPGFRKGNAPANVVEEHVGEDAILNEAAEKALSDIYPDILSENQIDAIGRPSVSVTKLAKNNPLGFTIKTAVSPELQLPNYKESAKEALEKEGSEQEEVTDKEVDDVLHEIRKSKAQQTKPESEQSEEENGGEQESEPSEEELPELNDEFAQSLGEFQGVEDLKQQIKQNLQSEKGMRTKEKKRLKIVERIVDNTDVNAPEIMIESELDKMINQVKNDVEQNQNYTFDDYLKHIQKTEEDIRNDWKGEAEKRAKVQLVLNKIAEEEGLNPSEDEIEANLNAVMERYPDADKKAARTYVETVLANEKVYNMLESQGEESTEEEETQTQEEEEKTNNENENNEGQSGGEEPQGDQETEQPEQ